MSSMSVVRNNLFVLVDILYSGDDGVVRISRHEM